MLVCIPNPSRTRPDDNSIVRRPCSFGVEVIVENDVVTVLLTLLLGISITAGLDDAICFWTWLDVWFVDGKFLIFIWTLSVVKTGGGDEDEIEDDLRSFDDVVGLILYVFSDSC